MFSRSRYKTYHPLSLFILAVAVSAMVHGTAFALWSRFGSALQAAALKGGAMALQLNAPAQQDDSTALSTVQALPLPTQQPLAPKAVAPARPMQTQTNPNPSRSVAPRETVQPELPLKDKHSAPVMALAAELRQEALTTQKQVVTSKERLGAESETPSPRSNKVATAEFVPPSYQLGSQRSPKPAYPLVARKFGWEGLVKLSVEVSASGRPERVSVLQSSGREVLDRVALETVRDGWLFEPARKRGQAVPSHIIVPVQFLLQEG